MNLGSIYDRAEETIKERRARAEEDAVRRLDEISKKVPELAEIKTSLSRIGLETARLFMLEGEEQQIRLNELRDESLRLQERQKELLKKNGYAPDALQARYTCPVCRDTGTVKGRKCKCYLNLVQEYTMAEYEKIAPFSKCTFETFDLSYYPAEGKNGQPSPRYRAEKILEYCRSYAQMLGQHSKNLLLMGGTGIGKTHLSIAIANVAVRCGKSVTFGTSQNILSDLESEHFGKEPARYDLESVTTDDLLVIDDLGTEFQSQFVLSTLYNIINTRIMASLPTVINTNYDMQTLEEMYGRRITSRLAGDYDTQTLEGTDIRTIKK